MIFKLPPQFGQCSMSMSKTRLSSLAQLRRSGAPCAWRIAEGSVAGSTGLGMISLRNFAFGANTPWKRPYIRSVADYHIGDHVYVTLISRACWNEDHRGLIPLTRIKGRLSRPVRERI